VNKWAVDAAYLRSPDRLVTIPSMRQQAFNRRTGGSEFEFGMQRASHMRLTLNMNITGDNIH
jgi:hypothetical protein